MPEHYFRVPTMDCDYYRYWPPQRVLFQLLSTTLTDIQAENMGRTTLMPKLGAVWMISHMRFYQYAPINPDDEIRLLTFPRVIEGNRYIFYVEAYRGDELVIRFDTSYIAVHNEKRKVVKISEVEALWPSPPRKAVTKYLHRLRPHCEFTDCGSDTVRLSDCDCNHHLTSGAYLALACNALDFWGSEERRYMKMMQLDYSSEVRPGVTLKYQRGEENGVKFVRGIKPDGVIAFTAACIW